MIILLNYNHINHNTLDNRRTNLRLCTKQQNAFNKLSRANSSSKYKGVYWNSTKNKWQCSIIHNGKIIYLGRFNCEKEAAKIYDVKAKELFGEFALFNFVE